MLRSLLLATTLALPLPVLAQDADTVLATVGETEITLGNLIALRARLPEQYQQLPDEVLFQGMLDQLIQQQVLADVARTQMTEADTLGVENETRAFLAGRQIDRLSSAPLDEADVQAAYEAQYGSVDAETEWNASHILVDTPEEARAVAAMLNDGSDFAELAREKSTGPSGPNGGQLGWFGTGQMVPEFETAVSGMEAGDVSEPVQTQFGWHVVKLNETRLKEAPPLEEVRNAVEQGLREQALDAAVGALTDAADINRVEVDFDPAIIRSVDLLE